MPNETKPPIHSRGGSYTLIDGELIPTEDLEPGPSNEEPAPTDSDHEPQ